MKYFIILIMLIPMFTYAANESTPRNRTITQILFYENDVVVRIDPPFENTQNCSSESDVWLQLGYNTETGKNEALVSAILSAAAGSKKVGFGIGGCKGQYPQIYRVDVVY